MADDYVSFGAYSMKLNQLRSATEGKNMRELIVYLLKASNNSVRNAKTFNGKRRDEYVLKSELGQIQTELLKMIQQTDKVEAGNQLPPTANAIRNFLGPVSQFPN